MTNQEIKKQLNLAIRTLRDPQGLAAEHIERAFNLLCEQEQASQPATRQGLSVRTGASIPASIGEPVPASGVHIVSENTSAAQQSAEPKMSKRAKLIHAMQRRGYPVTGSTLIKEAGITRKSLSQHLNHLRKQGYIIRCERTGLKEGRYSLVKVA